MLPSTIAICTLAVMLVAYSIPRIPLVITTVLAMLAMPMFGIVSFPVAFSGFSNMAIFLIIGMTIVGRAFFTTGLAERTANILFRFVGTNEKHFVGVVLIVAGFLGIFLNATVVVAMIMLIIDCIVVQSDGAITRKQTYFPLGVASVLGNNLTTISATSMIAAAGIVSASGQGEMTIFTPTLVNLPAFLVVIVLYMVCGYSLQQKFFDFPEIPVVDPFEKQRKSQLEPKKWKMVLTVIVLVVMITSMVLEVNYGACALLGASVLILTGCIDDKEAFRCVSWPTVFIVASAIGFSQGLEASGAGVIIADFIVNLCGPLGNSPFAMCVILFFIGSLLSNVMSDNATVAIIVPIALMLAKVMACDPMPLVLATASGVKVAVCTPISVAPMTMVQVGGYRFKDYLKIGGLVNIVTMIVTCIAIKVIYYM